MMMVFYMGAFYINPICGGGGGVGVGSGDLLLFQFQKF